MGMLEHEDYGPQRRAAEKAIGQTRDFVVDQATDPLNYLGPAGKGLGVGAKVARGLFATTLASKAEDANAMFFGGKYLPAKILERLEEMLKQGVSKQQIFEKTGYFKNPQGEWRKYVSDMSARPAGALGYANSTGKLENYLVHPQLYKQDPRLATEITVDTIPGTSLPNAGGQYDPYTKTVSVVNDYGRMKDHFSVLLHEVQHAIQDIGKVNGGANPEQFTRVWNTPKTQKVIEQIDKLETLFNTKWSTNFEDIHRLRENNFKAFYNLPQNLKEDYAKVALAKIDLRDFYRKASNKAQENKYMSNPGEVEARVTQRLGPRDLKQEPNGLESLYDLYGKEIKHPQLYEDFQFTFD